MSYNFLVYINISLILLIFSLDFTKCLIPATGRCGRPGLPPKATKHLISEERSRFENKEKVIILCKKGEFPFRKHEVICENGRWVGNQARCGRRLNAQVTHLEIFDCQKGFNRLLVSQPLNQSAEGPSHLPALPPNSFHSFRVPENHITYANGSNCYSFDIHFEKKVQIWFLLIDIWVKTTDPNVKPDMRPDLGKYRACTLAKSTAQVMKKDGITVFGYYFNCDLKNGSDISDFKREELEMSDTITVKIKTNVTESVGLDAVIIGDIFTEEINSKTVKPDCGQIQNENIGVNYQEEVGHTFISCNDSFIDISGQNITLFSPFGNPKHKFICNWNGQWVGNWPECVPKVTCPQDEITEEMESTVMVEEIGNVYYLDESKWFAINDSFIRYSCLQENDIMVGKKVRTCLKNGKWNSKPPTCTRTGISSAYITVIMFVILVVFVLIVFFVFRTHSRRVNRELRETREEINGSQRKRISEEYYADFKSDDNFYENSGCVVPKTVCAEYESVEYDSCTDPPRYEMHPHVRPPSPEYLDMLATK